METLNSAARAAGFAMAAADEPYEDARAETVGGRPSEALMLTPAVIERHHKMGDWFRAMLGFFWRRAPASHA